MGQTPSARSQSSGPKDCLGVSTWKPAPSHVGVVSRTTGGCRAACGRVAFSHYFRLPKYRSISLFDQCSLGPFSIPHCISPQSAAAVYFCPLCSSQASRDGLSRRPPSCSRRYQSGVHIWECVIRHPFPSVLPVYHESHLLASTATGWVRYRLVDLGTSRPRPPSFRCCFTRQKAVSPPRPRLVGHGHSMG